jgi:hypothetical protein
MITDNQHEVTSKLREQSFRRGHEEQIWLRIRR